MWIAPPNRRQFQQHRAPCCSKRHIFPWWTRTLHGPMRRPVGSGGGAFSLCNTSHQAPFEHVSPNHRPPGRHEARRTATPTQPSTSCEAAAARPARVPPIVTEAPRQVLAQLPSIGRSSPKSRHMLSRSWDRAPAWGGCTPAASVAAARPRRRARSPPPQSASHAPRRVEGPECPQKLAWARPSSPRRPRPALTPAAGFFASCCSAARADTLAEWGGGARPARARRRHANGLERVRRRCGRLRSHKTFCGRACMIRTRGAQ